MGGASPLATWIGASLALHLVAAALWWAAPAPPAPVAQARHLALEILDGGETQAQRAEHQQSGITEVRPAGDLPAATSSPPPPVHRVAIRQPVPLEPPARRAEARPARDTATPPPVDRTSARAADTREATPSVALATAPQPAPDTHITQRLQDQLLERLAEQLRYPPLARARGWEGVVLMELRLEANGDISRLQVRESSGYPLLDRAARQGLLRVARLPQAVAWLQGEAFELVLPVQYRLIDL